jgi:hypothetical protein
VEVEDYIYNYEGVQQDLLLYMHQLLLEEFNLTEKIRFKIPFYYQKSWICFLSATKNNSIELGFLRGNELSNAQDLLDSKGRKQVYSIEFTKRSEIPMIAIREILQEAVLLDENVPYASKRKK